MLRYIEITVKDSEDVYYIPKLSVRDIRLVVNKCLSLISPIIGDGIDSYQELEQERIRNFATADPDDIDNLPEEPDFKLFSAFTLIGNQLDNDVFLEVQDILLKGAKYSSKGKVDVAKIQDLEDYDIDATDNFSHYLRLLKASFQINAYTPFVECLNDMGFSAIVGKVQAVLSQKLVKVTTNLK